MQCSRALLKSATIRIRIPQIAKIFLKPKKKLSRRSFNACTPTRRVQLHKVDNGLLKVCLAEITCLLRLVGAKVFCQGRVSLLNSSRSAIVYGQLVSTASFDNPVTNGHWMFGMDARKIEHLHHLLLSPLQLTWSIKILRPFFGFSVKESAKFRRCRVAVTRHVKKVSWRDCLNLCASPFYRQRLQPLEVVEFLAITLYMSSQFILSISTFLHSSLLFF